MCDIVVVILFKRYPHSELRELGHAKYPRDSDRLATTHAKDTSG